VNDLMNVDRAVQLILENITVLPSESVPIAQVLGRVLAEDVTAGENIPPFANSGMDGYAVRSADVEAAAPDHPVRLPVVLDIPAGATPEHFLSPMQAARIMTGAPLPEGADAVVPVEQTDDQWLSGGGASLPESIAIYQRVNPGEHVRLPGEDIRIGQTVLRRGTVLHPQDMGVLASLGCLFVPVIRQPRVAIVSTGSELIDVDQPLTPGKIRNSNRYVLAGLVTTCGGVPVPLPTARDTIEDVQRCFLDALACQPDLIISSAGVSAGVHDVVRTVIDELGEVHLWRVNLRPGKPLVFGRVKNTPFLGLPGNPVSAMITFDIFVRPVLLAQGGRDPADVPVKMAVVGENLRSDGRRSYLRVKLTQQDGRWVAHLTGTQSSAALMSMVLADGLLIIPEGVTEIAAGSELPVRLLRDAL
jgi:molybdopterin molybdotransferase